MDNRNYRFTWSGKIMMGPLAGKVFTNAPFSWSILIHGGAQVTFSQMPQFWDAMLFPGISRGAVAVSSVLGGADHEHSAARELGGTSIAEWKAARQLVFRLVAGSWTMYTESVADGSSIRAIPALLLFGGSRRTAPCSRGAGGLRDEILARSGAFGDEPWLWAHRASANGGSR